MGWGWDPYWPIGRPSVECPWNKRPFYRLWPPSLWSSKSMSMCFLVESACFLVGNDVWSFSLGGLDAAAAAHPRISTWWCPIWSTWWRLGSSHWTNWEAEFDTIPHEKPIRKKICCRVGLCLWKTRYVYNMTGVRQGYLSRVVQACDMFLQDHSISAKHSAWIITFSTVPNIIY